jgi:hypothetical protein|tara:strand:+ start:2025 stop:2441 length:417 start_codon:yes stop_codon:yes gene_type:complete
MSFSLKTTSKQEITNTTIELISKTFDLEDVSIVKKFSLCHVSYKLKGEGVSSIKVYYKIDGQNWSVFKNEPKNLNSTSNKLHKTSDVIKTATFRFPKNTLGKTVALRLYYNKDATYGTAIEGFELSNISFTYRAINRK